MLEKFVTAKELAKDLKVSVATINYYTNIGLFKVGVRKGNVRLYDKKGISSVFDTITNMRKEGYTLRLIQRRFDKGYSV
ncbi:MAG: MerR family transcriptional regulator [Candidatus Omnitrophota bacterium]